MNVDLSIPNHSKLDAEEMSRIMSDCAYFIDNYCVTFDPLPRANGHHLMPFKLYDFQKAEVPRLVNAIRNGHNLFYEKSRDMGISWLVLSVFDWFWNFEDGFQAILGSRKEDFVDNFLPDSLFGKLDILNDNFPFEPEGFVKREHRNRLKLLNPMNKNSIQGESSNPDWSRSGRYTVGLLDEIAFWDNAAEAWGAAQDSCSCIIGVTTPSKKPSFAKALRNSGIVEVVTLHWREHPLKDDAWYAHEKATRLPEDLAREVDINWEGSITGRVYPEINQVRMGNFPYRFDWPLFVSHDPGHKPDPHAIGYFQVDPETGRIRLIESGEFQGKIAEWFGPLFGYPISSDFVYTPDELLLIEKVSDWKRGTHMGDQAGRARNQVTGTSLYDEWMRLYEIYVQSNTKENDLQSRKEATQKVLMRLDINDTVRNRYFYECIKDARYPDISDNSNRITANDKPIHDWTSHLRTMLEYFSVGFDMQSTPEPDVAGTTFAKALSSIQSNYSTEDIIY